MLTTGQHASKYVCTYTALAMTGYALVRMFKNLYRNDKTGFQKSQRLRVAAQILAFTAFAGGVFWEERQKTKSLTTPLKDKTSLTDATVDILSGK
jgi:hypothetical protein